MLSHIAGISNLSLKRDLFFKKQEKRSLVDVNSNNSGDGKLLYNFICSCFFSFVTGKDDIAKPHWTWLQGEFPAFLKINRTT